MVMKPIRLFALGLCLLLGFSTLSHAQRAELVVQAGHSGPVMAVTYSPDGRLLASAGLDNAIQIWDVATGKTLRTLFSTSLTEHTRGITAVAFHPAGDVLASSSVRRIQIWDVRTGQELRTLTGSSRYVHSLAYSPDGKLLASGDSDQTIHLWDAATGQELRTLTGHSGGVNSVAFSGDSRSLASASFDHTVRLWDVAGGRQLAVLTGHSDVVESVAFSPDGKTVASGSRDRTTRLWDADAGRELRSFGGHTDTVESVSFSPDGRTLASGSRDRTIRLWTVRSRESRTLTGHSKWVQSVSFSSDSEFLASGGWDGTVKLWDVAAGVEVRSLTGQVHLATSVAFSPTGEVLASGADDGTIRLWDLTAGRPLHTLTGHSKGAYVWCCDFSPDGAILASASQDGAIRLWDVASGQELRSLAGVQPVRFSPDGKILASGSRDGTVQLWDVASGTQLDVLAADSSPGRPSATRSEIPRRPPPTRRPPATRPETPRRPPATTGRQPTRRGDRTGRAAAVDSLSFSPDGQRLASSHGREIIRLWDLGTRRQLRTLDGNGPVAFGPRGKLLASVQISGGINGEVVLWDAASWRRLHTLSGHINAVGTLAFSPDGNLVASGSTDTTIRIWDVHSGRQRHAFAGPTRAVSSVAFHPGGRVLAGAFNDGRLKLWAIGGESAGGAGELCTLFAFPGDTWAVVDPKGRYDAAMGGEIENLHWVVDNEPIELSQLKERYYEPGLLSKLLGLNTEPVRDVEVFDRVALYPEVELEAPRAEDPVLRIKLSNRGGGIGRVAVFINGKEITADARGASSDPDAQTIELSLDLSHHKLLLPGRENTIEVRVSNAEGYLSSRGGRVVYVPPGESTLERPFLWAIVAGISDYKGEAIDLRYAAKDAADMAQALEIGARRLLGADKLDVRLLTTSPGGLSPTRENLKKAFEAARQARPEDILVIYLAGHGISHGGQDGDFYYLTREAATGNLTDPAVREQTAISSTELTEWIKEIPALKQVLILDTCASGRLVEKLTEKRDISSSQVRALERMKDRMGLYVLAGSAADAVSYEASRFAQGLLTWSLLYGMRGAALREDQFLDVSTWFENAADKVPQLARDIGGIQRPVIATPRGGSSFDIGLFLAGDKAEVPLAQDRPMVVRTNFQDEERFRDHLELSARVNEALRVASSRGQESALAYVDAGDFPTAFSLAGRYRLRGGSVEVTGLIFKGDEKVGSFDVTGATTDLEHLASSIVSEVERRIASLP